MISRRTSRRIATPSRARPMSDSAAPLAARVVRRSAGLGDSRSASSACSIARAPRAGAHATAELTPHGRRPVTALEPVEEHQPHARVTEALLVAERLADGQAPLEHRSGLLVAGSMEVREPLP